MSPRAQQLLDDLTRYIRECEESNDLLEFAEHTHAPIEWNPESGVSLRDALRAAKRKADAS